jgi:hypothetical protein
VEEAAIKKKVKEKANVNADNQSGKKATAKPYPSTPQMCQCFA